MDIGNSLHTNLPRPILGNGFGKEDLHSLMTQIPKKWVEPILKKADRALDTPIPSLPRSLYDDFRRTGRRTPFEGPYFKRRNTAEELTIAYLITGKEAYFDRCRDYIWTILEEFTWVLPAHAPKSYDPERVTLVDLFSSGTAQQLADLYDMLYDNLDDETKSWIRTKIRFHVLYPLREHFEEQWWTYRYESNWCGVCCGNTGCALILTALDETWAVGLLSQLLKSIDGFLGTADPDGAWVEGVSYWVYGFSRVIYFADLLSKVTQGKIDLLSDPRIKATATFPLHSYLPPKYAVNFGDTSKQAGVQRDMMVALTERYKKPELKWYIEHLEAESLITGGTLRDFLWKVPDDLPSHPPEAISKHYKQIGWIITRKTWTDPNGAVLAVKAGNNGEPHNHNDVGQFIFHVFGESFIKDIGVGVYDRAYFGPERYKNPVCGAEGHNLIFIDGKGQENGAEYRGEVVEYEQSDNQDRIVIDMTGAYPSGLVERVIRTLLFLKQEERLVLVDEVECQNGTEVETRLHVTGKLTLEEGMARISTGQASVTIVPSNPERVTLKIGIHEGLELREKGAPVQCEYLSALTKVQGGKGKIALVITPYREDGGKEEVRGTS